MEKPWKNESELRRRYVEDSQTLNDIAEDFDCHIQTIANWLERYGIERRSRGSYTSDKLRDEDWMREAYIKNSLSQGEIANQLDCAQRTVGQWLERHDIPTNGPGDWQVNEECADEDLMKEYYVSKEMGQYEIADEIGVDPSTVNRWLHRHNIETRVPGGQRSGENSPFWKDGFDGDYGANWERQRNKALDRDGHKCRRCGMSDKEHKERHGSGNGLHVHHIRKITTYKEEHESPEWYERANKLENLITLCNWCHKKLEGVPIDNT